MQTFDIQVAAHIRHHLFTCNHRALERRVAAGFESCCVTRRNMGVGEEDILSVRLALRAAGVERDAHGNTFPELDRHANAAATARTLAFQIALAPGRHQVELVFGLQADVVAGSNLRPLQGDIALLARAPGRNADILTCRNIGNCGGVGSFGGGALILAAAHGNGNAKAACGALRRGGHGVSGILRGHHGRGPGKYLHPGIPGVLCGLLHLIRGLERGDNRVGQGNGQPALLKFGLGGALARLPRFKDIDLLGIDIDIALRSHHVTAHLSIVPARCNQDIAFGATDGCGCRAGLHSLLIRTLFAGADGKPDPAGTEQPGFLFLLKVGLLAGVDRREDVDVAYRCQGSTLGTDDVAAQNADILAGKHSGHVAGQRGAQGRGLIEGVAGCDGLAGEKPAFGGLAGIIVENVGLAGGQIDIFARRRQQGTRIRGDRSCLEVEIIACA